MVDHTITQHSVDADGYLQYLRERCPKCMEWESGRKEQAFQERSVYEDFSEMRTGLK